MTASIYSRENGSSGQPRLSRPGNPGSSAAGLDSRLWPGLGSARCVFWGVGSKGQRLSGACSCQAEITSLARGGPSQVGTVHASACTIGANVPTNQSKLQDRVHIEGGGRHTLP